MKSFIFFGLIFLSSFAYGQEDRMSCMQRCIDEYNIFVKANDKKYDFDEQGKLISTNNEGVLRKMEMLNLAKKLERCQKSC
ncbi:MAG: hypothetical protein OEY33_04880 [Bdellovibrionales bacterium]|nr:hypothetical protein [Bdellovibrionales bacterium]